MNAFNCPFRSIIVALSCVRHILLTCSCIKRIRRMFVHRGNCKTSRDSFLCQNYFYLFSLARSLINILLFTGTKSMTKQVPSKHDTTRTVISILPLATFHQWLITLVDCSTPCANLTPVSLYLVFFFSNSCSNSNWNWYCLKTVMWILFFCESEWPGWTFFCCCCICYKKKQPKHFVMVLLQVCTSSTVERNVTVSLFHGLVAAAGCTGCTTTALKG